MDLRATQTAIVAHLTAAFANTVFTAQELPEVEADYQRAVPNAITYVLYTGSEPVEIISTDPIVQRRKLKFNVECYGRLLYGAAGLFEMRQLIESAIIGFQPPNCERLYLAKDEISRGEDLIWAHVYNLECFTILVQDNFAEPIAVPALTNISDNE